MMRTAVVTGHTRGIGKAIYQSLQDHSWNCIGFSGSTGHDIRTAKVQDEIAEACESANLFINSAHSEFAQTVLLEKIFSKWKNCQDKTIISIGVDSVPASNWEVVYRLYSVEKVALHAAITKIQNTERKCRVTNLCLGHVDTLSNSEYSGNKLSLANLCHYLHVILEAPSNVEIRNITLSSL